MKGVNICVLISDVSHAYILMLNSSHTFVEESVCFIYICSTKMLFCMSCYDPDENQKLKHVGQILKLFCFKNQVFCEDMKALWHFITLDLSAHQHFGMWSFEI